jgi:branched-chain amino acid transport system permease protein
VQLVIAILTQSAFYMLLGLGFNLVFRASGVVNLAQGEFLVIGGLMFATLMASFSPHHGTFWISLVVDVIVSMALGFVLYYVALRSKVALPDWVLVILTLAVAEFLDSVITVLWGSSVRYLNSGVPSGNVTIFGSPTPTIDLFLIGAATVAIILAIAVFSFSRFGLYTRAVADNPELAASKAINVRRVVACAWGVCFVLSSIGGLVYGVQNGIGLNATALGLSALPAIMIGGMGSISGTAAGALIVGAVETIITRYQNATTAELVAYGMLLAILLIRPQGLFGMRTVRQV